MNGNRDDGRGNGRGNSRDNGRNDGRGGTRKDFSGAAGRRPTRSPAGERDVTMTMGHT
ncbi:hypothetical protein ABZX65_02830 [Streptomyces sp. NPDC003300]|uniref:hypothetical protein n=1 Tax=unclassified Streptomyces TaxID=2593676 RepID=UPI0033B6C2AB